MYIPHYYDALCELCVEESFVADYSEYVRMVLHKKHYGKTRKYRR